jgi:hypothetical protein
MTLVSILITGGLTATATTNVPISSHSRTREAQILRQARAPACPFPEREGQQRSRTSPIAEYPQVSISTGQPLDRCPIFQAGHAGSIPIAPLRASVCAAPRARDRARLVRPLPCRAMPLLEPVRTTTAGATGTRWEKRALTATTSRMIDCGPMWLGGILDQDQAVSRPSDLDQC